MKNEILIKMIRTQINDYEEIELLLNDNNNHSRELFWLGLLFSNFSNAINFFESNNYTVFDKEIDKFKFKIRKQN